MKILISQKEPSNLNAYKALEDKYGAELEFHPFFLIEPLSAKEFRSQRINLPDYTAIVFSSRHAIDAYFKMCDEMRFKVPETMKYFCTTELVALYLQKHVVYRKRKIFFGDGSVQSIVAQIGPKHKGEKFLITTSAEANTDQVRSLFE
ncbi:MAG: uroporphyrinogen-III synthase, partial [Bacteroidales bacterium]|nr:uroporphyrinogen-III synthase [Bacteroidales bacterium]